MTTPAPDLTGVIVGGQYARQTWIDEPNTTTPTSAARLMKMENGIWAAYNKAAEAYAKVVGMTASYGSVSLDDPRFGGTTATDDQRLAAANKYCIDAVFTPAILFEDRFHEFKIPFRDYNGMKFVGRSFVRNVEVTKTAATNLLYININGPWIMSDTNPPGGGLGWRDTWNTYIGNLAFEGNDSLKTTVFWYTGNAIAHCCVMENVTFQYFKHVLGTNTHKWVHTACTLKGYWDTANAFDTSYIMGGSDSNFWTDGHLLDSGVGTAPGGATSTTLTPHVNLNSTSNSVFGPMYVTAEGPWYAFLINGSDEVGNSGGGRHISFAPGGRYEGRNPNAPCFGALFRIGVSFSGGAGPMVSMHGVQINNAMSRPGTSDKGVVTVEAGRFFYDGGMYQRAATVPETVPFVYADNGSHVRVSNVLCGERGGAWIGGARVRSEQPPSQTPWPGAAKTVAVGAKVAFINGDPEVAVSYRTYTATAIKPDPVSGAARTSGLTGSSQPTWPRQVTNSVVDGDVTWELQTKVRIDDTCQIIA